MGHLFFLLASKIGFSAENLVFDVVGDIQGCSMSTLQELGAVNPALGSALWKFLQTSLDSLMKSIQEDGNRPVKGTKSNCPAGISLSTCFHGLPTGEKQLLALPESCCRAEAAGERITLLAVTG